jgi:hypothetical protein
MTDFDSLMPGSAAAKAKGCSCRTMDGAMFFRADWHCPLHGLEALTHALDEPPKTGVIEDAKRARRRQRAGEED